MTNQVNYILIYLYFSIKILKVFGLLFCWLFCWLFGPLPWLALRCLCSKHLGGLECNLDHSRGLLWCAYIVSIWEGLGCITVVKRRHWREAPSSSRSDVIGAKRHHRREATSLARSAITVAQRRHWCLKRLHRREAMGKRIFWFGGGTAIRVPTS